MRVHRKYPGQIGLTLVEMSVALALSSALLLAALSFTSRLGRAAKADRRLDKTAQRDRVLAEVLEHDLRDALQVRQQEQKWQLRCQSRLVPETLDRVHLPSLVTYRLRTLNGKPWLVREQQLSPDQESMVLLVAEGIDEMTLLSDREPVGSQWKDYPKRLEIAVRWQDSATTMRRPLLLR